MPVEGQWERLNNPLPERDKRVLMMATFVVVLGAAVALIFFIVHPSSSHAGCVKITVPSTMGGAVQYHCGGDAKSYCRENGTVTAVAAQCRRLGDPTM